MITKLLFLSTSNNAQDLIISRRILEGEQELFQLLIKPYKKDLYYTIRSLTKDSKCIEETFYNTCHTAFRTLYRFHGQLPFRVWLIGIGMRAAEELVKNQNRISSYSKETTNTELDGIPDLPRKVFVLRKLLHLTINEVSYCLTMSKADVQKNESLSIKLLEKNYKKISSRGTYFDRDREEIIDQYVAQLPILYQEQPGNDIETTGTQSDDSISAEMHVQIDAVQHLKDEHLENMKLCSNIRSGFARGIEMHRIKRYADWYWRQHLSEHFSSEESMVFPILGKENEMVKKAMAEHRRLRRLFESNRDIHKVLSRIEEELESHIRFEEKVLFKEIERTGPEGGAAIIEMLHNGKPEPVWIDEFWK